MSRVKVPGGDDHPTPEPLEQRVTNDEMPAVLDQHFNNAQSLRFDGSGALL